MSFKERVINEKADLGVKLGGLNEFLHSSKAGELTPVEFGLLMVQQRAMTMYIDALTSRIESL